jgi:hypothetical protein
MIRETIDVGRTVAPAQSVTGQPITSAPASANASAEGNGANTEATPAASATVETPAGDASAAAPANAAAATSGQAATQTAQINLPPQAVEQIATLSQKTREQKARIEELEKAALDPSNAEVKQKLARLDEWEKSASSPRKLLELSKKTLEEVAADVLAADSEVVDPRVTEALTKIEEQKTELAKLKEDGEKQKQAQSTAESAQHLQKATTYVESFIKDSPEGKLSDGSARWEHISKDANIAKRVVAEASRKHEEKFKDGKTATLAEANAIIIECLDELEAGELAKQILEARKKGAGQPSATSVERKGIEFVDSPDDKLRLQGTRTAPPPGIGTDRSPTRTVGPSVERGQTDVRTARARAHKIAGA